MTPKDKAQELVDKYKFIYIQNHTSMNEVKQCAIISVDEIIKFGNQMGIREPMMYWNKVKEEIEKL